MRAFLILGAFLFGSLTLNTVLWTISIIFGTPDDLDSNSWLIRLIDRLRGSKKKVEVSPEPLLPSQSENSPQLKQVNLVFSHADNARYMEMLRDTLRGAAPSYQHLFERDKSEQNLVFRRYTNNDLVSRHIEQKDKPNNQRYSEAKIPASVLDAFDKYTMSGKAN